MSTSVTRRFTVPPFGQLPLPVVTAADHLLRVLVRNEGTGLNEDQAGALPAPLFPFNFPGPPLTLPASAAQACLLALNASDLYTSAGACYRLPDGASDVLLLAPRQELYVLSATSNVVVVSVQLVHEAID